MTATTPVMELIDVGMDYSLRRSIGKSKRFPALRDINLTLAKGETLGVMGRNGCGKSSLLRLIAGIVEPTQGHIRVSDKLSKALLTIGLGFNRELSGRDNALLSAMLQGYKKRDAMLLIPAIQDYSELGDFFDQPVKTYSSGMRSKLGFATAIVVNVDVLLIDETLSVGDSQFKKKAEQTMLDRINSDQTVVFVSHQSQQVKRVCQQAIWLEQGAIVKEGDVSEVAEAYDSFMSRLQNSSAVQQSNNPIIHK